nr:hypothetical protein [[Eubacterium] tenue]
MNKRTDRIGEVRYNTYGSKMKIVDYISVDKVKVYFKEYDYSTYSTYNNFLKGLIKCPYNPVVYGVGYLGVGKYQSKIKGIPTKAYRCWHHMLERCYSKKYHKLHSTYTDCSVDSKWHNFQNFAKWYHENCYEFKDEKLHLDKDILNKGNKIYSEDACVFVPQSINVLFTKSNSSRGKYPIGVTYHKKKNKYISRISKFNTNKQLGMFNTIKDAFFCYKHEKELHIKYVADLYKHVIPTKLYTAMYNYQVEITD